MTSPIPPIGAFSGLGDMATALQSTSGATTLGSLRSTTGGTSGSAMDSFANVMSATGAGLAPATVVGSGPANSVTAATGALAPHPVATPGTVGSTGTTGTTPVYGPGVGPTSPVTVTAGGTVTSQGVAGQDTVRGPAGGSPKVNGTDFGAAIAHGLDALTASQQQADQLAVASAAGLPVDPAQLTIATSQATLMTQVANAIQSKAVTAFNTIMGMQA